MSLPESTHFLNMHLIQASTWLLLWWWYADDVACSILTDLQNWQNLSDTKLVPMSNISLWGMPYSANIVFTTFIRLSAERPYSLLMTGNLLL